MFNFVCALIKTDEQQQQQQQRRSGVCRVKMKVSRRSRWLYGFKLAFSCIVYTKVIYFGLSLAARSVFVGRRLEGAVCFKIGSDYFCSFDWFQ